MADDGGDRIVVDEFFRDLCGDGAVGAVVGLFYLKFVSVDAAGIVDLFECELDAEARVSSMAELPRPRCADRVRGSSTFTAGRARRGE